MKNRQHPFVGEDSGSSRVLASAILKPAKSPGGKLPSSPPTAETLERWRPDDETRARAVELLRALGFELVGESAISLTIAASPERFEEVFDTRLRRRKTESTGAGSPVPLPIFELDRPVRIPRELQPYVAAVSLPAPHEFFP